MFDFFENCLFCNTPLPKVRTGEGEHVFPESIFGFWRSYDVCNDCIQSFGKEVDILAIQNVAILNAMESLKLKDTDPHVDNLRWVAEDTIDKHKVEMVKRGPRMRIRVQKNPNFVECSEEDLDVIAKPWIRELMRERMTDNEFEKEYTDFKKAYLFLEPGAVLTSKVFGVTIRRRQTTNVRVQNPNPDQFTRLIAKIVTCFIHYALPRNILSSIKEYDILKRHARHGNPLPDLTINPFRSLEEGKYFPFHRMVVYPDSHISMIDTTFFGNVNWRTVLHSSEPVIIKSPKKQEAETMLLVLDFSDLKNRNKYAAFKFKNEEEYDLYDVVG